MTRQNKEWQKREKKNKRKGQTGKDYEHVGLQEAPHLQDLKQNHWQKNKKKKQKQNSTQTQEEK
jgi:hypothetical protein